MTLFENFLQDRVVEHSCQTLFAQHSSRDTLVGHSCGSYYLAFRTKLPPKVTRQASVAYNTSSTTTTRGGPLAHRRFGSLAHHRILHQLRRPDSRRDGDNGMMFADGDKNIQVAYICGQPRLFQACLDKLSPMNRSHNLSRIFRDCMFCFRDGIIH